MSAIQPCSPRTVSTSSKKKTKTLFTERDASTEVNPLLFTNSSYGSNNVSLKLSATFSSQHQTQNRQQRRHIPRPPSVPAAHHHHHFQDTVDDDEDQDTNVKMSPQRRQVREHEQAQGRIEMTNRSSDHNGKTNDRQREIEKLTAAQLMKMRASHRRLVPRDLVADKYIPTMSVRNARRLQFPNFSNLLAIDRRAEELDVKDPRHRRLEREWVSCTYPIRDALTLRSFDIGELLQLPHPSRERFSEHQQQHAGYNSTRREYVSGGSGAARAVRMLNERMKEDDGIANGCGGLGTLSTIASAHHPLYDDEDLLIGTTKQQRRQMQKDRERMMNTARRTAGGGSDEVKHRRGSDDDSLDDEDPNNCTSHLQHAYSSEKRRRDAAKTDFSSGNRGGRSDDGGDDGGDGRRSRPTSTTSSAINSENANHRGEDEKGEKRERNRSPQLRRRRQKTAYELSISKLEGLRFAFCNDFLGAPVGTSSSSSPSSSAKRLTVDVGKRTENDDDREPRRHNARASLFSLRFVPEYHAFYIEFNSVFGVGTHHLHCRRRQHKDQINFSSDNITTSTSSRKNDKDESDKPSPSSSAVLVWTIEDDNEDEIDQQQQQQQHPRASPRSGNDGDNNNNNSPSHSASVGRGEGAAQQPNCHRHHGEEKGSSFPLSNSLSKSHQAAQRDANDDVDDGDGDKQCEQQTTKQRPFRKVDKSTLMDKNVVLRPKITIDEVEDDDDDADDSDEKAKQRQTKRETLLKQLWVLQPLYGGIPAGADHAASARLLGIDKATLSRSQRYEITPFLTSSAVVEVVVTAGRNQQDGSSSSQLPITLAVRPRHDIPTTSSVFAIARDVRCVRAETLRSIPRLGYHLEEDNRKRELLAMMTKDNKTRQQQQQQQQTTTMT